MTQQLTSVLRVQGRLRELGMLGAVRHLSDSARSAKEAADADYVREWSGFSIGGVPSMDFARN